MASPLDLRSPEARVVVGLAQTGDRQALDRLLRALQEPVHAHIQAIVRDPDASRDVLQDTLLIVARKLGWLRDPRWFRAWAYRIATREAIRRSRADRRWLELLDSDERLQNVPDPRDEELFEPELVARVPRLLESLPPAAQVVLRLHYLEGLTLVEIAEALEVPVGTVKSRLAYGLGALRKAARSPSATR